MGSLGCGGGAANVSNVGKEAVEALQNERRVVVGDVKEFAD